MSEKLIIRNFGPIKEVKLDLKKFNLIIGEQATGKSTIAKVLAVCRYFSFIVSLEGLENKFGEGLVLWGLEDSIRKLEECYKDGPSYISYECEHYKFEAKGNIPEKDEMQEGFYHVLYTTNYFSVNLTPISQEFKALLNEFRKVITISNSTLLTFGQNQDNKSWEAPTSFYQNEVSNVLNNPFYLPTERGLQSLFSLGKNSIQNISDSLFNQFANLDAVARKFTNETKIEPLKLFYYNKDGRGFIRKENETRYFALNNGASGYQSTIPIVLVNKFYKDLRKKTKTFLIEEPELNLFPIAQKELINYLVSESANVGNQIFLTTHSPYILTSLNNLMYAYEVGKIYPDEAEKVIERKYWLNPDDVSCYFLEDGEVKSIIDGEDGLIMADYLDIVSTDLNNEFLRMNEVKTRHELEHT